MRTVGQNGDSHLTLKVACATLLTAGVCPGSRILRLKGDDNGVGETQAVDRGRPARGIGRSSVFFSEFPGEGRTTRDEDSCPELRQFFSKVRGI